MNIPALIRAIPGAAALLSETIAATYMQNLMKAFLRKPPEDPIADPCDHSGEINQHVQAEGRIRLIDCACYLLMARIVSSSPRMPLRVGSQLSVLSHGPLGEAALSAPSMEDALELLHTYTPMALPFLESHLEKNETAISLGLHTSIPVLIYKRDLMELVVSALARAIKDCVGANNLDGLHIELNWPRPDHWRDYTSYLEMPVHFDAPRLRLVVRRNCARRPLRLSNSAAYHSALERLENTHPTLHQRAPLNHRVAAWLADAPELPTQADTAHHFHMSPRALRSRLKREDTSFQALKLTVQLSRAMDLLAQTELSLNRIAEQAGFNSGAALSRAFRRRHNMSPTEFRRNVRPQRP